MLKYEPISELPVVRFWYQGESHTHPVRRTGLVIEWNRAKGYFKCLELREGRILRKPSNAPVKAYRFDEIAKGSQLRSGSRLRSRLGNKSTLIRTRLLDLVDQGI